MNDSCKDLIQTLNEVLGTFYDDNFYRKELVVRSIDSASIILGLLLQHYKPESVIDAGCGRGAWLVAAKSLGVKTLRGLDGDWVDRKALLSEDIDFSSVNFDLAMPTVDKKYDLCIAVEVAEHVSERNAKKLVDFLCKASETVIFGAAVKHQGGVNHINEQWQSYWIDFFTLNGYKCIDLFRGALWNNEAVEWWYRQNTFLFIGPQNTRLDAEKLRTFESPIVDAVHPSLLEKLQQVIDSTNDQIRRPTLRFCLGCLKRFIKAKLLG